MSIPKDMTPAENEAWIGINTIMVLAAQTEQVNAWDVDQATGARVPRRFSESIALMHSELSEALEADRKSLLDSKLPDRDGREVELADCIIRIMSCAAYFGLDVAGAVIEKNRFNQIRADHKPKNRANNGLNY